jgi:hypothetical protein
MAARAVSIRIGVRTWDARSCWHVSKPLIPGKLTSSTITSYDVESAIHSASSPSCATSASVPYSRRARGLVLFQQLTTA